MQEKTRLLLRRSPASLNVWIGLIPPVPVGGRFASGRCDLCIQALRGCRGGGDAAPFSAPNRGVIRCGTAGSGCQNSRLLSTAGRLFREVLDWISASEAGPTTPPHPPTESHKHQHTITESPSIAQLQDFRLQKRARRESWNRESLGAAAGVRCSAQTLSL